jgi:hypothetical protein
MDSVQILTSIGACADPRVVLAPENYEVMRAWLDFLFGKINYDEVNNVVTAFVAKNFPTMDLNQVSDSIKACADTLMGRRGT